MAVGVSRTNRIASFVLEKAIPQISNEIKRNDGIVAVFGQDGRIEVVDGGDLFEMRLERAENSNFGFRTKFAQIPTDQQDNWLTAKYGQAVLSGSAVINDVEKAQNQGEYAISNMLKEMIVNSNNTIVRQVADGLRAASPGANDPESIRSLLSETAFGSQTGTIGGLSQATYSTFWQNQVSTTAAALTAQAGVATLEQFYWNSVAKGAARREQPNFGLTTGTIYASLSAFGDNQRRYMKNEALEKIGFSAIELLNMRIIADPSVLAGRLYLLNTMFMKLQVLRTPQMKSIGDNPQTLPVSVKPFQSDIDSLNSVALMYIVMNLTANSLQRQGVMTAVT